jgi:predicted membrane protein
MGSVDIDLTRARMGPGTSTIELMVIMGSVTVIVPPDVRVEVDGDPFLGSFDVKGQNNSAPALDAPTIHVTGTAILGSVEVRIVDPNAPSWIEKIRTRWAATKRG